MLSQVKYTIKKSNSPNTAPPILPAEVRSGLHPRTTKRMPRGILFEGTVHRSYSRTNLALTLYCSRMVLKSRGSSSMAVSTAAASIIFMLRATTALL